MVIVPAKILLRFPRRILSSQIQKCSRVTKKDSTRQCSTNSHSRSLEELPNRSLIKVTGTEASNFLQGLITNDMGQFDNGAANIYTLFLNIKGRVMCESIIYKGLENSTYYVECDRRITDDLQKHLKMYRIRRKVDIESLEKTMKVWTAFDGSIHANDENDDSKKQQLEGHIFPCSTVSNQSAKLIDDMVIYEDPRLPELGLRILSNSDVTKQEIIKHSGLDISTSKDLPNYRAFRYRLGIGEGIDDLPLGKALPLEINCDYLHGVSFHKGCYIGQELTARTHHTGVVRKRLMPLIMEKSSEKSFNYDESIVDEAGKIVGKFRGREGIFGLGLMRITEALNAPVMKILDCPVTVIKPGWWPGETLKNKAADTGKMEAETSDVPIEDSRVRTERSIVTTVEEAKKPIAGGIFKCSYCSLEEHYDFRGTKPPFARQIKFSEDCYVMKDPMSLPNRGEVLVLGGNCSLCKKIVCLGCSIYYGKRLCPKCSKDCVADLPTQLHAKIKSLTKDEGLEKA